MGRPDDGAITEGRPMGRKRAPSRLEQRSQAAARTAARDWAALTWNKDRRKIGPLPIWGWNMIVVAILGLLLYFGSPPRMWTGIALAAFLGWTLARATTVMPRRREKIQSLYTTLQRPAGLPRSTMSTPVKAENHIDITEWGAKCKPARFTVKLGPDAQALSSQYFRAPLEGIVQKTIDPPADNQQWVFSWPDPSVMSCEAVDADDPRVFCRDHDRKMMRALCDAPLFAGKRYAADYGYELEVTERRDTEKNDAENNVRTFSYPVEFTFTYGGFDASDPLFREQVTTTFDRQVRGPGIWIYDWATEGELSATLVEHSDLRALRKKETTKVVSDCYSMVGNKRGVRLDIEIARWMPEGKKFPAHYPVGITIDFGTLNLGDRRDRNAFEEKFDTAMQSRYAGLIWLYDWQAGATTFLEVTAVPASNRKARQKLTEKNLRNVIETKFRGKEFVDCDVLVWQEELTESGRALPQVARVDFGSIDVSKMDTRDEFEDHWSSQTTECDWGFDWSQAGQVTITAAPRLPKTLAFPEVGSAEWEERMRAFRSGKVHIGPTRGGGDFYWDMSKDPHGLVGGRTGSGKSVTLDAVLNLSMTCRDEVDLVVCDPKRTDFTWVTEFPNVRIFAAGELEICNAVGYLSQEMSRRQSLLNRRGVKNLGYLRRLYAEHPEMEKEDGPAPKRLILIFDEIGNWWMRSADEDVEEAKGIARTQLEGLGQLARALEINMLFAAQKPDKDRMSTQLKEMCGFRLCVGPVDEYTSKQIIDSNHGTRFPAGDAPKGRAWAYSSSSGYFMVQVPYLPTRNEPCPWDPSVTLNGAIDRVRADLELNGYQQISITNSDGGQEPRWVLVEDDTMDAELEPAQDPAHATEVPAQEPPLEEIDSSEPDTASEGQDVTATDVAPAEPAASPEPETQVAPVEDGPHPRSARRASRSPGPAATPAPAAASIDDGVGEEPLLEVDWT